MEEENEAIKSKHGRYIVHSATAAYICHLLVLVLKYGSLLSESDMWDHHLKKDINHNTDK